VSSDVLSRPAPPPDFTVVYGEDPEQIADIRLPAAGTSPQPLVVFIHGGFWRAVWDRTHAGPLAAALSALGYPVACLEYRRVGQAGGGWPGTFDDVDAGVRGLPELLAVAIAERGGEPLDATRPILMGHSAGGQLALWAGHRMGADRTRGVVALAPVADLTKAYQRRLGNGAVAELLGGGPADVPERYAAADPAANLPLGVPAVVVHGDQDEDVPVDVGADFVARAERAGARVSLRRLPGVDHLALIDPLTPAWAEVIAALGAIAGG
jgi:acetyl esterase/lipase